MIFRSPLLRCASQGTRNRTGDFCLAYRHYWHFPNHPLAYFGQFFCFSVYFSYFQLHCFVSNLHFLLSLKREVDCGGPLSQKSLCSNSCRNWWCYIPYSVLSRMFRYFVGVFSFFSVIGESLMKLTSRAFAPCLNQVRLIFGLPSLVSVILCGMSEFLWPKHFVWWEDRPMPLSALLGHGINHKSACSALFNPVPKCNKEWLVLVVALAV